MASNPEPTSENLAPPTDWDVPVSALAVILGLVFIWRIFFTACVNLIPDECSYWTWSRRLDWSYFDNSGMVAYLIRLSTTLFGEHTPLSVRFPFLILSALTTFVMYRTSVLLFEDRSRALLGVVLFNLFPMVLLGGSAAMHDNAMIFFWVMTLWAAARFLRSGQPIWFYIMGLFAGLAMLSKYTGVLALAGLLLFFAWIQPMRSWLGRKEPWIGVVIATLFTVPILWWNMCHDWASLGHVLFIGSGSSTVGKRFLDGLGYHLAQFALLSPFFYAALATAVGYATLRNVFKPSPEQCLLLGFSLPLLAFGVQAFRGHVEANWGAMGYPSASILAVECIFRAHVRGRPKILSRFNPGYLTWGIVCAVTMAALVVLHAWVGLLPASVERKIAKEDRIIWESRGWDGLGKHVADMKKADDVLAADSYQLCALLEFNVPGNPSVRYLAPWKRPTQFDVWEPTFDNLKGRTILFVTALPLTPGSSSVASLFDHFRKVDELPGYQVMYHDEAVREIHIYRGEAFDPFHPRRLGPRSLRYSN